MILGTATIFLLAQQIAFETVEEGKVLTLGNWLSCDSFSALVLLLVAFVGLTAALFSWGYMEKIVEAKNPWKVRHYYTHYSFFLLSMLAVPLLSHLALVWIAIELTTLLSVFLVSFENTPEALEAAWKYIVLTSTGAAFALFGILLLYWGMSVSGEELFTWSGLLVASPKMSPILLHTAFLFILIGFGAKVGLVPLHTWLPDAHSQAPSSVCSLLSGVETTTVLYAILRLLPIMEASPTLKAGTWFVFFGLLSVGVAAFLLVQVKDYKRLFAFSTVEHMGIILVAAGLGSSAAHFGAMYQIMSHALTKSFCFFAAGATLLVVETRDISAVRGLIRESPIAGVSLLLGGLAIAGAPPFAVFLSEFSIFKAALANGQYLISGLLAFFIVLAFCGIMVHINRMVFGKPPKFSGKGTLPITGVMTLVVAAIPIIVFGLSLPTSLYEFLRLAATALGR
jgi:hydrogenase-4 component F